MNGPERSVWVSEYSAHHSVPIEEMPQPPSQEEREEEDEAEEGRPAPSPGNLSDGSGTDAESAG